MDIFKKQGWDEKIIEKSSFFSRTHFYLMPFSVDEEKIA
jgi:hypothetical protein